MQIKFPKHKKIFKKGGLNTSPDLFWEFLLLLAFFVILVSAVFGFLLFIKVNKEIEPKEKYVDERSRSISVERIDKALDYFSVRSDKSYQILNSSAPFGDPSL